MMICYCKLGKVKDEYDHVRKLVELKSSSSVSVFSELIKEVFDQNRFLDAYEYCVRINDAGISLAVSCYNMLITGLASRGYVDEARQVFDIMRERGVPPVCHLWKSLVFGFCKMERVEEAELLSMEMESYGFFVDKMIELGLEPDVLTYQIMIKKFCKEDKVDSALALLNSMSGRDLIPNVHCYTSIVPALFKENRFEVDEVYEKMLDSGVIPDQVMFFKLMKECPKGYELHLTLKFLHAIAKYGCGIDPLYSKASFGPTESIQYQIDHLLGRIVEAGPHLANMAYSIYIVGLCFGGKSDVALHNLVFMINLGFQPLISAYN
ncbi:pentatricopeptide repeat-containing protein At5g62370-like [Bidens hawaiensis]|uniref:pentatricopeptide repeat-containing protein At5g62370-like n=1 Tax=Bidens hawaiensis TaxID=980011 RepID=UPI00404AE52B